MNLRSVGETALMWQRAGEGACAASHLPEAVVEQFGLAICARNDHCTHLPFDVAMSPLAAVMTR